MALPSRESHIAHSDIVAFADTRVNLKRDDVTAERAQVNRLRDRLAQYINDHPAFDLVKMLGSGSLAKGTALKTISDVDVAVYMSAGAAPTDDSELIQWLAERLAEAYPTVHMEPQTHCVTMCFSGSGLDVDVVPVLYEDDPEFYGYLVARDTGDRVLTCIPKHLEFIRTRKKQHPVHFRQLIRLAKWWAKKRKQADELFRCKSFMLELIIAHLFDNGLDGADYPAALESLFSYIVRSGLRERIVFTDYYSPDKVMADTSPIRIFDPVNPANNVAFRYSDAERSNIVAAAGEALEAIVYAKYATTKGVAVEQWRKVFGSEFSA